MEKERVPFFDKMYMGYGPVVYKYAYRKTRNETDSEDIRNDTFEALWCCIDKVIHHEKPLGWLMRTAQYRILGYFEQKDRQIEEVPLELCRNIGREEPGYERLEMPFLDAFTPDERAMVKLVLLGFKREEVAEMLGMSYSACEMRILRMRKRILGQQKN